MSCQLEETYSVSLVDDVFDALALTIGARRALVVTTPTVDRLYYGRLRAGLADVDAHVHVTASGERNKTIDAVLGVCEAAMVHRLGRLDVLVALGGGICCDVVSVSATLIRRGVPYICAPTTLVGQTDAGIGLKGGINFDGRKNFLGCFKPPEGVLVDTSLLRTLPRHELRCGMAEILKMALIRDAHLFHLLRRYGPLLIASAFAEPPEIAYRVVTRAIELMLSELEPNCYENRTLERLVDFGHTFSPVLEERSGHLIHHGEAVAIDMGYSAALATELGLLDEGAFDQVIGILRGLGLGTWSKLLTLDLLEEGLTSAAAHRGGHANLVLLAALGEAVFVRDAAMIPESARRRALARLRSVSVAQPAIDVAHPFAEENSDLIVLDNLAVTPDLTRTQNT